MLTIGAIAYRHEVCSSVANPSVQPSIHSLERGAMPPLVVILECGDSSPLSFLFFWTLT
jgi:hypothetical protein